jgi:thiol-disulfide isomerase/thioredoxin
LFRLAFSNQSNKRESFKLNYNKMKIKIPNSLLDIITGVLVFIIVFYLLEYVSFSVGLLITGLLSVIAGMIRGKNVNEGILAKVVRMNLLFILLFFPIMNGVFHLFLLVVTAPMGTALGIYFKRTNIVLILFSFYLIFILVIGFLVIPTYITNKSWRQEVTVSPDYLFVTPENDTIKSSDLRGKIVVMDFWATWCGPCIKQMPELEKTYQNYKDNEQIAFFVLNTFERDTSNKKAVYFIKQSPHKLPFMLDVNETTSKALDVKSLPTIVIIDKDGNIRFRHFGYEKSERFHKNLCSKIDFLLEEE